MAFLVSLPIAFVALIPASAVSGTLKSVLDAIAFVFPFKATLDAVNNAFCGPRLGLGPLVHLAVLTVVFWGIARLAVGDSPIRRLSPGRSSLCPGGRACALDPHGHPGSGQSAAARGSAAALDHRPGPSGTTSRCAAGAACSGTFSRSRCRQPSGITRPHPSAWRHGAAHTDHPQFAAFDGVFRPAVFLR